MTKVVSLLFFVFAVLEPIVLSQTGDLLQGLFYVFLYNKAFCRYLQGH